jgi:hypothetical protein
MGELIRNTENNLRGVASDRRFKAFIMLLNIAFVVQSYNILNLSYIPGDWFFRGTLAMTLLLLAMALLGVAELFFGSGRQDILAYPKRSLFVTLYATIFCVMMISSLFDHEISYFKLLGDTTTWLMPSVAIFGMSPRRWGLIKRSLLIQGLVACVVVPAFILMPIQGLLGSFVGGNRSQTLKTVADILIMGGQLLYGCGLIYMAFSLKGKLHKFVGFFGALMMLNLELVGQFRNGVFAFFMSTTIAFIWIPIRSPIVIIPKILKLGVGICVVAVICLALFSPLLIEQVNVEQGSLLGILKAGIDRVHARIMGEGPGGKGILAGYEDRLDEAQSGLSESTSLQWVIGKGVSGHWSGNYLPGEYLDEKFRDMLHFGPAHLVLKGGLCLLLLMLFFPFGVGFRAMMISRDPFTLACAGIIIVFAFQFTLFNNFMLGLIYTLRMLCAGRCLAASDQQAQKKVYSGLRPTYNKAKKNVVMDSWWESGV